MDYGFSPVWDIFVELLLNSSQPFKAGYHFEERLTIAKLTY